MAVENIRHSVAFGNYPGGNYMLIRDDGSVEVKNNKGITHSSSGSFYFDPDDKTLSIVTGLGNTIQVGQEVFGIGVNKTGSQIDDGTAVTMAGAQGNRPKMVPADAAVASGSTMVGVTTTDITNNAEGPVTVFGIVRGYNTTAVGGSGLPLYLLANDGGGLTSAAPTVRGQKHVWVATTLNDTINGSIFVNPIHDVNGEYSKVGATIKSLATGIETITTNTVVSGNQSTVLMNTSAGNVTATLQAASAEQGREFIFKCTEASNTATVSATDNIDGSASFTLALNAYQKVQSDGTTWWKIG
jgi:hypothetical protein